MAYCLRSFVQILEQVLHPDQHYKKWVLDQDIKPQVQSLLENGIFLRDFLDNSSPLIQHRLASLEDQIMDAAQNAEDTLETYLTSQLMSSPEGQAFTISPEVLTSRLVTHPEAQADTTGVNWFANILSKISKYIYTEQQALPISSPNLGEAIQSFEDAKKEVIKIMDECQRPDDNVLPPASTTRYPYHNNVVVGVTEDLNQLRSRLTSRSSELDIIPIVGMGGMGKTTLARILYDQFSSSKSQFDCFAWLTVSQTYDLKLILRMLLESVTRKPLNEIPREQTTSELIVALHKTLFGRRYLIVLDDIWSTKAWDDIQRAFPRDSKGSRIILTTREKTVVDYVNPKCHEMHLIDEDESWELLLGKVFGEESCPPELEEVGKKIARSCGGLPLALQVIGGLLSQSQKSIEFWEHVGSNVRSLITETGDQFSGIFDWSFTHLPHYLKPCFLYMASFREDESIPASKVIKLWVSEGFLLPIRDKSLEEAARMHLNALVDRNLIFVRGMGKSGRAKSFGIHDLLRDLCLRKAQEKKFIYFKALQEDVLFFGRIVSVAEFIKPPILTPLTRSIRSNGGSDYNFLSCLCFKLSLLRVLDLPKEFYFSKLPGAILRLVNLRHLHIRVSVPPTISVLRNLQMLIVTEISSLAMILSDMPQLRHLKFEEMKEDSELQPYGVHEHLQSLCKLPAKEIRKLLGKLPNLRKLTIDCAYDEEFIDLTSFHNLESLTCWDRHSLSHNINFPVSLRKMTVRYCKISQSLLDAIGELPNLQILRIVGPRNDPINWEPSEGGFCELQYLEICIWELVNWLATEVHFPVLERLVLNGLPFLTEIPNDFGAIETLKIIEVEGCKTSVFDSARKIYEEQCEFGNTDLQLKLGIDLNLRGIKIYEEEDEEVEDEEEDGETEEE